ncbi:class I SAM-dependent methyltransferase [Solihabitans fulvus]|uniref:Class I SAM-dependent methyltransferase n=2 Tax=Solihabitans fulvus TaxID=1892852 RepID=A0A5B2XHZ3_9PSEU|nr:class I SAM-dependent methyltransferase [Solihabitans fulvus]
MRAVDEVVGRYYRAQSGEVQRLRSEIAELRAELHSGLDRVPEELRRHSDRLLEATSRFEHRQRRDLMFAAETEAARQSEQFAREVMPTVPQFADPHATLEHALTLAPEGGLTLEFGVYTGTTLKIIAAAREGGGVFGFDSFEGLPENWRSGFTEGAFGVDSLPEVPGADLVVGWFDDTLPAFLEEHDGPVHFLHVDCDLYSSTKTVLDLVGPRLRPGSIVVFDEYFNYPGWQEHEHKAWLEHVEATGLKFSYEGYTADHEQVIVKLIAT